MQESQKSRVAVQSCPQKYLRAERVASTRTVGDASVTTSASYSGGSPTTSGLAQERYIQRYIAIKTMTQNIEGFTGMSGAHDRLGKPMRVSRRCLVLLGTGNVHFAGRRAVGSMLARLSQRKGTMHLT